MDNEFPKSLYRDGSEFVWDGRPTDRLVVNDAGEQEAAAAEGWAEAADYPNTMKAESDLLDQSAKQIAEALPSLSLKELEQYKAAEVAGKSRKGVLALLDAAIDEALG